MTAATNRRVLPGDFALRDPVASALRVDHAGEYGATRIYAGQLAVLKHHETAGELRHMAAQEQAHLDMFNRVLPQHGVRPTLLMPFWHIGGWLMGAIPAMINPRAAMAVTVAVEEVITEHYNEQLASGTLDPALATTITQFRDEEMEHHNIGLAHEAEKAPLYRPLTATVRAICKGAIWLSARV